MATAATTTFPNLTSFPNLQSFSRSQSHGEGQSSSGSFIPDYSQTPILEDIANYARSMAPQVYQWGMDQFNKNQGDIDSLMRDALQYASPQRIATDMGMAETGVQQAGEAGRQSAIKDLESYGIDPSSGRYAALDSANRVMTAAAAAGAGNQQRMADQAAGNVMRNQAIASGLQNTQLGYQGAQAMNALLGTAMQLKYPPLGQTSQSTNVSDSTSLSETAKPTPPGGGGGGGGSRGGGGGGEQGGGGGGQGGGGQGRQPAAMKPQQPPLQPPGAPKTTSRDEEDTGGSSVGMQAGPGFYDPYGMSEHGGALGYELPGSAYQDPNVSGTDANNWVTQNYGYDPNTMTPLGTAGPDISWDNPTTITGDTWPSQDTGTATDWTNPDLTGIGDQNQQTGFDYENAPPFQVAGDTWQVPQGGDTSGDWANQTDWGNADWTGIDQGNNLDWGNQNQTDWSNPDWTGIGDQTNYQDNTDWANQDNSGWDNSYQDNTDWANQDNSGWDNQDNWDNSGGYDDSNWDNSGYDNSGSWDDSGGGGGDYSDYYDYGGDSGGYQRGGPVRRRPMMQRPPMRPPMTGYRPRPMPGPPRPPGALPPGAMQRGGPVRMRPGMNPNATSGGFVSRNLSPSRGAQTDDVNARLNTGEFVIPKDVAHWKGKEFFYKLIAQARKLHATSGAQRPRRGYALGGAVTPPPAMGGATSMQGVGGGMGLGGTQGLNSGLME